MWRSSTAFFQTAVVPTSLSLLEIVGAAVIEMTGDPQEHIGLVASGRQHLFKPFAANVLLATVEDALHSATCSCRRK